MKKKRNVHKNEGTKEMQVGSIVTPENEKQQCGEQKWGNHVPFFFFHSAKSANQGHACKYTFFLTLNLLLPG